MTPISCNSEWYACGVRLGAWSGVAGLVEWRGFGRGGGLPPGGAFGANGPVQAGCDRLRPILRSIVGLIPSMTPSSPRRRKRVLSCTLSKSVNKVFCLSILVAFAIGPSLVGGGSAYAASIHSLSALGQGASWAQDPVFGNSVWMHTTGLRHTSRTSGKAKEGDGVMTDDDTHLLTRAIEGDLDYLGRLLSKILPELRRSLDGQIGTKWQSKLDVEDVLQVTCLEAFLSIDQFKSGGMDSFVAWVRRIAKNNLRDAIDALSADKRPDPAKQVQSPKEDSHLLLYENLGGKSNSPSKQARREEAKSALDQAIRKLPDDYRTVVTLRELEGMPVAEVARIMKRGEGAVHMLRARALGRLRELLGTRSHWLSES